MLEGVGWWSEEIRTSSGCGLTTGILDPFWTRFFKRLAVLFGGRLDGGCERRWRALQTGTCGCWKDVGRWVYVDFRS